MTEKHLGSSLDDFLEEEGLLAEAESVAAKRVVVLSALPAHGGAEHLEE